MPTILDTIVAAKREEIARAKAAASEADLRKLLDIAPPVRDFFGALTAGDCPDFCVNKNGTVPFGRNTVRLIAEIKKASPSKGVIRADFNPVAIARVYENHGAACLSVLTDQQYFHGSLEYLRQVRAAVDLPVLRKDFIIDSYQVIEARAAGADAVLLIAECLDDEMLHCLHRAIVELGMTPLVEFYEPANLARVFRLGAKLIGINNRNLHTFEVDLGHTLRMRQEIPPDCVVVAESGIRTRQDVERLASAGVQAMLVGETLMAAPDIGRAVDELLGKS
jgi:indole-3-glycerol phosphate synthase